MTGMGLSRHDQADRSGRGHQVFAAVEKTEGAPFDDPEPVLFVRVTGETLVAVGGMEPLEPRERAGLQESDV